MSRHEFSAKTKALAFERSGGRCEGVLPDGTRCDAKLMTGKFRYDHRIPDWIGGANSLENCQVLGFCCDSVKTPNDQRDIAKVKRIRQREQGIKKPRTITRWRKMNGDIVIASKRR